MEARGQFEKKQVLGERAELFVFQLIDQAQGLRFRHGEAREEGSDIVVIGLDGKAYGIEIKAIKSFLTRDNTGLSKCGELYFEILSKDTQKQGSLYQWLFPQLWMTANEKRPAVTPKRTHCVLYGNEAERKHPFCCLTFDTHELFYFLHAAGKEWGWDIFDPLEWSIDRLKGICSMEGKAEKQLPAAGQYIVKGDSAQETTGYCWYVPLNKIISAADKITMVGDQPPIVQRHIYKYEKRHPIPGGDVGFQSLQQARYNYLSQHSKGAKITNTELEEARKKAHIYKERAVLSW